MFALPPRPASAAMLTIFPCPAAIILGTTARAVLITDFALRSSISSQVSSGVSCTGCPMRKPPAILHRASIRPNRSTAVLTALAPITEGRPQAFLVAAEKNQRRPRRGECRRDRAAEIARRAGDQAGLAFERHEAAPSLVRPRSDRPHDPALLGV